MNFDSIQSFVFFGGGPVLRAVLTDAKKWREPVYVITSHWQAEERYKNTSFKEFLRSHHISYSIAETLDDASVQKRIEPGTLGVSISACWIFNKDFIARFKGRLINIHGTPLPRYGGGGGASWPLMQGSREGGATVHFIDGGIDTGDVLASLSFKYPAACTTPLSCDEYALKRKALLLSDFLKKVRAKRVFTVRTQDAAKSTYWPRLATDIHGFIDWNWQAKDIQRFISAFDEPYGGASTFVGNSKVRLKNCHVGRSKERFHPFQWGLVYRIDAVGHHVACNGGTLTVKTITHDGGTILAPKLGDRLYTPQKFLEEAKLFRAVYTSKGLKKT
jgi:methionyl-tRNA formyltransferase